MEPTRGRPHPREQPGPGRDSRTGTPTCGGKGHPPPHGRDTLTARSARAGVPGAAEAHSGVKLREPEHDPILQLLQSVWKKLDRQRAVGTFDEPKSFFYGQLEFYYAEYQEKPLPSPVLFLAGATDRTVLGLGGSLKYVVAIAISTRVTLRRTRGRRPWNRTWQPSFMRPRRAHRTRRWKGRRRRLLQRPGPTMSLGFTGTGRAGMPTSWSSRFCGKGRAIHGVRAILGIAENVIIGVADLRRLHIDGVHEAHHALGEGSRPPHVAPGSYSRSSRGQAARSHGSPPCGLLLRERGRDAFRRDADSRVERVRARARGRRPNRHRRGSR